MRKMCAGLMANDFALCTTLDARIRGKCKPKNMCYNLLLEQKERDPQNMHGATGLTKKKIEFPTVMHAQCKLSEEGGKFCF